MLLPSVNGTPFVVGTFVSNMLACFLFAMLTEYMATASWLRRRVRQAVSRGVGLGFLGGLSTMSGVMLETMEGLREHHVSSAFGYLAGSFVGGIVVALAGVAVMQFALARGARKRLRGTLLVSDSGESDTYGAESMAWMSVSPESDTLGTEMSDGGVKHAKVADVAHSAAQAALEAAPSRTACRTAGGSGCAVAIIGIAGIADCSVFGSTDHGCACADRGGGGHVSAICGPVNHSANYPVNHSAGHSTNCSVERPVRHPAEYPARRPAIRVC